MAGELLNYTITVQNTGNMTLTGVVVTDPNADAGSIVRGADVVGDNDAMLEVGETWGYTAAHTLTQAEIDSNGGGDGDIDNIATADFNETGPDTDDAAVPLVQDPDITIVKSALNVNGNAGEAVDAVGDIINYSVVFTNTGNCSHRRMSPLKTLSMATHLSILVEFWLALLIRTCRSPNLLALTETSRTLDVGESWKATYSYTVDQAVLDAALNGADGQDDIDNTVTVTANPPGAPSTSVSSTSTAGVVIEPPGDPGAAMTPGFWKNHASIFLQETGKSLDYKYEAVFSVDVVGSKKVSSDPTLGQALGAQGGGEAALLRASTAGWANASSDDLNYCFTDHDTILFGFLNSTGTSPLDPNLEAKLAAVIDQLEIIDLNDDGCLSTQEVIKVVQDVYNDGDATTNNWSTGGNLSDAGKVASLLDIMNNMPHNDVSEFFP